MSLVFSSDKKTKLLNCNFCYMLGTLAAGEQFYPTCGEEQSPVTIMNGSSNVIFYIKPMSTEPDPVTEILKPVLMSDLYIGVDSHQMSNSSLFPLAYRFTNNIDQKKQMIYEVLQNKLVLFRPKINFAKDNHVYKNLEIISIEREIGINENTSFIPIPQISMSNADFERKVLGKSTIILEDYSHIMTDPKYILCGNYIYYNFPEWTRHKTNNKAWICEKGMCKIYRIKINTEDKELKNKLIRGTDNLVFMDREYLRKNVDEKSGEDIERMPLLNIVMHDKNCSGDISSNTGDLSEIYFLKALKQCTVWQDLCYDMKDLINFHICIKTNPLTILAGMSGTGKTQLALSYAKMLDLTEEDGTLLFLPISPSYTEPMDLLGYLNSSSGSYVPSETGFTDFLVHAKDNPEKMHMVIFDEMNLSQVEHWFAPFISLFEKEDDRRILHLYSSAAECRNKERYPDSILIGKNIIFIGTVNMDETTRDFSDRLLDRANVIVLNKKSFVQLKEEQENEKNSEKMYEKYFCSSYDEYSSWIKNTNALSAYSGDELEFFDELHDMIQKFDEHKGVSFRIIKKMGDYINNIPEGENDGFVLSREDAFDIEVRQRLITKIKGTEKQFEKLIGVIRDDSDVPQNSLLYDFFSSEKAEKISHFTLTKKEISRKAKELGIYGYAG